MNEHISHLYKSVIFAGAAVALAAAVGCLPQSRGPQLPLSATAAAADGSTCLDEHIKSIWKGEAAAGPECVSSVAYHASAPKGRRRIQTVCERVQIRTILTGESPTSFTQRACAETARDSEPAIRRACMAVFLDQSYELDPVQLAACSDHLQQELSSPTSWSGGPESATYQGDLGIAR